RVHMTPLFVMLERAEMVSAALRSWAQPGRFDGCVPAAELPYDCQTARMVLASSFPLVVCRCAQMTAVPQVERVDDGPARPAESLPRTGPHVKSPISGYSSHCAHRSLRPWTVSRYASCSSRVTGPGGPIRWSSTSRIGVTSAAVPHMNTSSARY